MCCLSSKIYILCTHEWEDCRTFAILKIYLPPVTISKRCQKLVDVWENCTNPRYGEQKRYLAWFDDSRGFSPSQAASWTGGYKNPSSCARYLSSLSYLFLELLKKHRGICHVRPLFKKHQSLERCLRRSPRFPHPAFWSKTHAVHVMFRDCDI